MIITININEKDIQDYEKYKTLIEDYPVYGHTSGLSRNEIVAIGKLCEIQIQSNDYNTQSLFL